MSKLRDLVYEFLGNIKIHLPSDDGSHKLIIEDGGHTEVASVDSDGNATFTSVAGNLPDHPHSGDAGDGGQVEHDNMVAGTIAAHDTTATGAELDTLTDDSMADALHRHSELSASDGTPNQAVVVDATGNVGIGETTPTASLHVVNAEDNANVTIFNLEGKRTTPTNNDTMYIYYRMYNNAPASFEYARTTITAEDITATEEEGSLLFEVARAGVLETVLKMSATEVVVNEPGADRDFRVEGVGEANALVVQGSDGYVGIGTAAPTAPLDVAGNITCNDINPTGDISMDTGEYIWASEHLRAVNDQDITAAGPVSTNAETTLVSAAVTLVHNGLVVINFNCNAALSVASKYTQFRLKVTGAATATLMSDTYMQNHANDANYRKHVGFNYIYPAVAGAGTYTFTVTTQNNDSTYTFTPYDTALTVMAFGPSG